MEPSNPITIPMLFLLLFSRLIAQTLQELGSTKYSKYVSNI